MVGTHSQRFTDAVNEFKYAIKLRQIKKILHFLCLTLFLFTILKCVRRAMD